MARPRRHPGGSAGTVPYEEWRAAMNAGGPGKPILERIENAPAPPPARWPDAVEAFRNAIGAEWKAGGEPIRSMIAALNRTPAGCLLQGNESGPGPFRRMFGGTAFVRHCVDPSIRPPAPHVDDSGSGDRDFLDRYLSRFFRPPLFRESFLDAAGLVRGELPVAFLYHEEDREGERNARTLRARLGLETDPDEPYVDFAVPGRNPPDTRIPTAIDAGSNPHFRWPPAGSPYGRTHDLTGSGRGMREVVSEPFAARGNLADPDPLGKAT